MLNIYKIRVIFKKILTYIFYIVIILIMISFIIYIYISNYSKNFITKDIDLIKKTRVAIVLGTSPKTSSGNDSLFFINRMNSVKELFDKEKIEYIIVSGDNKNLSYNEPKYMRNYLLKIGINNERIISDYGGRRTLDSVLRSNQVFNQDNIIIISQKFHNERAIFIAKKNNINAIGYNSKYPYKNNNIKNIYKNITLFIRELIARDLAVYDILIKKKPLILGDIINIENENIDGIKRLILDKNIE